MDSFLGLEPPSAVGGAGHKRPRQQQTRVEEAAPEIRKQSSLARFFGIQSAASAGPPSGNQNAREDLSSARAVDRGRAAQPPGDENQPPGDASSTAEQRKQVSAHSKSVNAEEREGSDAVVALIADSTSARARAASEQQELDQAPMRRPTTYASIPMGALLRREYEGVVGPCSSAWCVPSWRCVQDFPQPLHPPYSQPPALPPMVVAAAARRGVVLPPPAPPAPPLPRAPKDISSIAHDGDGVLFVAGSCNGRLGIYDSDSWCATAAAVRNARVPDAPLPDGWTKGVPALLPVHTIAYEGGFSQLRWHPHRGVDVVASIGSGSGTAEGAAIAIWDLGAFPTKPTRLITDPAKAGYQLVDALTDLAYWGHSPVVHAVSPVSRAAQGGTAADGNLLLTGDRRGNVKLFDIRVGGSGSKPGVLVGAASSAGNSAGAGGGGKRWQVDMSAACALSGAASAVSLSADRSNVIFSSSSLRPGDESAHAAFATNPLSARGRADGPAIARVWTGSDAVTAATHVYAASNEGDIAVWDSRKMVPAAPMSIRTVPSAIACWRCGGAASAILRRFAPGAPATTGAVASVLFDPRDPSTVTLVFETGWVMVHSQLDGRLIAYHAPHRGLPLLTRERAAVASATGKDSLYLHLQVSCAPNTASYSPVDGALLIPHTRAWGELSIGTDPAVFTRTHYRGTVAEAPSSMHAPGEWVPLTATHQGILVLKDVGHHAVQGAASPLGDAAAAVSSGTGPRALQAVTLLPSAQAAGATVTALAPHPRVQDLLVMGMSDGSLFGWSTWKNDEND